MVFLKRSTTALLALIVFSLASTVFTSKVNAQSVSANNSCLSTQFPALASLECKSQPQKKSKAQQFVSVSHLVVSPTAAQKEKLEEKDTKDEVAQNSLLTTSLDINPEATLSADTLFDLVNQHRKGMSLAPFEHDSQVCSVAESRKEEIASEIFVTHFLHAGFYAKNLPYFATENMIWQHTEAEALTWWLNSPIHRSAIEGSYKYACGVCNGEVCNMVFTSYDPKSTATFSAQLAQAAGSTPPQNTAELTVKSVSTVNTVQKGISDKLASLNSKN